MDQIPRPNIRVWVCPYCGRSVSCPANYYSTPNTTCHCQSPRFIVGMMELGNEPAVPTPPPSQEVKELFHKLWGQAASGEYVKSDWIRLQVLLKC